MKEQRRHEQVHFTLRIKVLLFNQNIYKLSDLPKHTLHSISKFHKVLTNCCWMFLLETPHNRGQKPFLQRHTGSHRQCDLVQLSLINLSKKLAWSQHLWISRLQAFNIQSAISHLSNLNLSPNGLLGRQGERAGGCRNSMWEDC